MFKKIKDKFNEWTKSMAEENQKQFGDKELSCCSMNKNKEEK